MPFSYQVKTFTGHGGGKYTDNTDICLRGKKTKQNSFPTKSKSLQVMEVENMFNTDICSRGKKTKQNRKRT